MGQDLVEIEPRELKFPFELKKQSSCSIHLVNKSDDYVAFKVKTTSPKRYCVRPNTGIILPRSSCDFTVTMQAQKTAPLDMQLKDKFLVQTTAVPFGATEEDIVPDFFSKGSGRFIEENKLRVVLISPPNSPEHIPPANGSPIYENAPLSNEKKPTILGEQLNIDNNNINNVSIKESPIEAKENIPIVRESSPVSRESPINGFNKVQESPVVKREPSPLKGESSAGSKQAEAVHLSHVTGDLENLKSKLHHLESKLEEAEKMIIRMRDESNITIQEKDKLQKEMVLLRKKSVPSNRVGFPFLFVVYMVFVGMALGYFLQA